MSAHKNTSMGEKIKKLRKEREMTQKQLAKALYVTQQNISKYETGSVAVPFDFGVQIANYFGVSMNYFTDVEFANHQGDKEKLLHYYEIATAKEKKLIMKVVEDIMSMSNTDF